MLVTCILTWFRIWILSRMQGMNNFKMRPIVRPETSKSNYQSTLLKIPEVRRSLNWNMFNSVVMISNIIFMIIWRAFLYSLHTTDGRKKEAIWTRAPQDYERAWMCWGYTEVNRWISTKGDKIRYSAIRRGRTKVIYSRLVMSGTSDQHAERSVIYETSSYYKIKSL